jgi:hypothetical protein
MILIKEDRPTALLKANCETVGSGVLTAVIMNNSVFWDITPCTPLKISRRRMMTFNRLHGVIS